MTPYGGANGYGTVFSITPSGTEIVLHSFGGSGDGEEPVAGLIRFKGKLYGTTASGGANGDGTVFSIAPSGRETVRYSFKGGSGDGANPSAGLVNVKDTLYGTTSSGGANSWGTVFSMTSSTETVLHSFGGSGDGKTPAAGLVNVKDVLYGTTNYGGANGAGTVFSIAPSGTENVLHSFGATGDDGANPLAGLVDVKGTLYGTTFYGGAYGGNGTVFSITPSGAETVLHRFEGGSGDGREPHAGLIYFKGKLYGTTVEGGAPGEGTVFWLKQ